MVQSFRSLSFKNDFTPIYKMVPFLRIVLPIDVAYRKWSLGFYASGICQTGCRCLSVVCGVCVVCISFYVYSISFFFVSDMSEV